MAIGSASGADSDIGLMLKAARLAEASKESEIRMRFARDVAAPLLAKALGSKRVWVFGSASAEHSRSQEGCLFIKSMLLERTLVYGRECSRLSGAVRLV